MQLDTDSRVAWAGTAKGGPVAGGLLHPHRNLCAPVLRPARGAAIAAHRVIGAETVDGEFAFRQPQRCSEMVHHAGGARLGQPLIAAETALRFAYEPHVVGMRAHEHMRDSSILQGGDEGVETLARRGRQLIAAGIEIRLMNGIEQLQRDGRDGFGNNNRARRDQAVDRCAGLRPIRLGAFGVGRKSERRAAAPASTAQSAGGSAP